MLASSFVSSPLCAFTLNINVSAPAVVLFQSLLIASRNMSASGAPTNVVFVPSLINVVYSLHQPLVVAKIKHRLCHRGAA